MTKVHLNCIPTVWIKFDYTKLVDLLEKDWTTSAFKMAKVKTYKILNEAQKKEPPPRGILLCRSFPNMCMLRRAALAVAVCKPGTTEDFKAGLCQGSLTKVGAVAKPLLEGKAPPKSQNM